MRAKQINGWIYTRDGRARRRTRHGFALKAVLLIMSFGLCQCAEDTTTTTTTPTPAHPRPSQPQSPLERAKSILGVTDPPLEDPQTSHSQSLSQPLSQLQIAKRALGVTDQPSEDLPLASHSDKTQDKIKFMERKVLTEESSKASAVPDTQTDAKTTTQTNPGLIKSILKAVSRVREGGKEAEGEKKELPSPTLSEKQTDDDDDDDVHSGAEERTKNKEKFIKVISKVVLNGTDSPEVKEKPSSLAFPSEDMKITVPKEVDTDSGTSKSEVPTEGRVTEVVEQKTESMLVESVSGEGGGDGGGVGDGGDPGGKSEGKETKSEVHRSPDTKKEGKEKAGRGSITPAVTLEEGREGVQPLGRGIEAVTKALGVLDVKVDEGDATNTSTTPASGVHARRNVFPPKSNVTLSHIFGPKDFWRHFPDENFTYHRTHRAMEFKPSLKTTTASKKTEPQHKSEPEPESREPVERKTVTNAKTEGAEEEKTLSTPVETQEKKESKDAQASQGDESAPSTVKTLEDSMAASTEGKEEGKTEVDEGSQKHTAHTGAERTTKSVTPSELSSDQEPEKATPRDTETTKEEAETEKDGPHTPSEAPTLKEPTAEPLEPAALTTATESKVISEKTAEPEKEEEIVIKVEAIVEEAPSGAAKEKHDNLTEKVKEVAAACDGEEKEKPAGETDAPEEPTKKKKKESEKAKKKEAAVDVKQGEREKTSDTLETYSQFTQRVNAEKKNDIVSNGHGTNGHGKGPKVKSKNYASPDCGSKLLSANPEANHASKVIHSNKDEYLLNKCRDKTWFVIELCESIRPQKFDIANFELFSNLPKDINLLGSHRYPSREWTPLAKAQGQEGNRGVQSFPVETEDFFKYIKVEVLSHYGSEFFCPISLFRIYGLSEFEVIDTAEEPEDPEEPDISETQADEKQAKDEGKPSVIPAVLKNMFSGVLDVIKRGYRPHSASSEPGDSCYTLQSTHAVDKRSCQLADSLNYILSCYHAEYQVLMQQSFVSHAIQKPGFCRLLASTMCLTPEVSDGVVYDTVCNSSYLCIMLSPKHMLAMCFMHDSRIVNMQVACESTNTILPENFSATTPPIVPPENRLPSYVKNAKINTSTITRTDATIPNVSGTLAQTDEGKIRNKEKGTKQAPIEQVAVSPEDATDPALPDPLVVESSKPKKPKVSGSSQDQVVKEEDQPDNTTEPEERAPVEGSGMVGLEVAGEKSTKEVVEKQVEEAPVPATPLIVEPKLPPTSPTNKESVMVRLSNKIKALEYNMSISSQYLEELSRWYKSQMEEMQRQFNLTIAALNATSHQAFERDQHHQRDIETLEKQLASITAILGKLVDERENLAHTVVEQHLLLMVVEVVVLCVVFVLCHKRTARLRHLELERQERRAQTPSEDSSEQQLGGSSSSSPRGRVRRRSVDSITRERSSHQRRSRRPSEEALRISGTYEDLLIIEPAIPIMVDSVSERKKKRKSSSGTLKRSKSNASIVENSCLSTRRSQRMENLDMSSAGVLFFGDQVDAVGTSNLPQADPASPQLPPAPHEPYNQTNIISSRSYVEEMMSESHPRNDIGIVSSNRSCLSYSHSSDNFNKNVSRLTKSQSFSCASEKLKNGAEKKKTKKMKRKNYSEDGQQHLPHGSEMYQEANTTSYNGQSEHNPEYYHNGRSNSVHFSETPDASGTHMFCSDVTNTSTYVNGDSYQDVSYVGNDYIHPSYVTNFSEKRRASPATKVKLRSDNWEWYSLQHFGSSSETVSTCSDSSGKMRKDKVDDVPQTVEHIDNKKARKKKKSKARSPVLLEEETNGGT